MLIEVAAFRQKLEKLQNLPAMPNVLDKFNEMVKDPAISMGQIGDMIAQDQMLAAKMLKLVNSAFYGFPGRISTIKHALVLLGYDVVKSLILSATVFDVMSEKWAALWKHSVAVSKACGLICAMRTVPNAEEIGMAGLLHDVGKVVLMVVEPQAYQKVLTMAEKLNMPMQATEKKLLGFDHVEVATWLCERWNLPKRLMTPMIHHHEPEKADYAQMHTAVVFVANNVIKAIGWGTTQSAKVEPMPASVIEQLQLDELFLTDLVTAVEKEIKTIA